MKKSLAARGLLAGALATAGVMAGAAGPAHAANPWYDAPGFLNMAHQGGELEAPGNTLYAFKTAMRDRGADSIEMDAYVTSDDELVISHDPTVNDTTNGTGAIWDKTLAEVKQLDAAYKFSPGKGEYGYNEADPHPFRGIATGDVPPPPGYTANDFKIPTFKEVIAAFPNTRINIDLKHQNGRDAEGERAAEALAEILKDQPGGDNENVLVASFGQKELVRFNQLMPGHRSITASESETLGYVQGDPITPKPIAIQPPDSYNLGGQKINTESILRPLTLKDRYALHVWGADGTEENDALYQRLVDGGVQGFFTQEPSKLADFLCREGIVRPDGSSHCVPATLPGLGSWADPKPPAKPQVIVREVPGQTVVRTVTVPGPTVTVTKRFQLVGRSVKLKGKRGTLKLRLSERAKVSAVVRKGKRVVARLKGKSIAAGASTLSFKLSKKLKKGTYKVTITAKQGKTSTWDTLTLRVK